MSTWTKKERFLAVLSGEIADRPPISAWGHFVGREETAIDLAQATIEFQKEYDWDFIKINPRATIFGEAWGNVSDFNNYVGDVPAISHHLVHGADELNKIQELDPTKGAFREQLEATQMIKEKAGEDTPVLQTIFTPMAIVEYLCGHRTVASSRSADRKLSPLSNLIEEHPADLHRALQAITDTLVNYIQHAIKNGADGFFYAVLGLARDGFLSKEEFKEFGTKYDLMLLEATKDTSLLMHTCGPQSNPERFKDYPVHSIHWADNAQGNPSLAESISWNKKCLMGGVDEELFKDQDSDRVIHEARKTIQALKDHPFILAPGCGLPVGTNAKVLRDFRDIF